MTHVVLSQTWLLPGEEHVDAYLRLIADFDHFLQAQPGFVSRRLIRSLDDRRHLIHVREFDDIASYEAMIRDPDYRTHIEELSAHVDASAYPDGSTPKEFGEVVFDSPT